MSNSEHSLNQYLEASLKWWEDAGVQYAFTDNATVWLQESAPEPSAEDEEGSVTLPPLTDDQDNPDTGKKVETLAKLLGDEPPATLEAFRQFWLEAPGLSVGSPGSRVAPRGPAKPALMILVLEPEASDGQTLLSGPQGALALSMLKAMGLGEDTIYFASALPRHTPMADTAAIARSGMAHVLLHHIRLVEPAAVLAFGTGLSPFLEFGSSQSEESLREDNHKPALPPTLESEALGSFLEMPRLKARFWRRWIEWSAQHL